MISIADISIAVQSHWHSTSPQNIPTQFPGVPLDANRLNAWIEFWLTQGVEPVQRSRGPAEILVLIDVHCFSRQSDKGAVFQLADQVRTSLSQQLIPVPVASNSELPPAQLRIYEAVTRDLTRESQPNPRSTPQHLVVSLHGRAKE